MRVMVQSAVIVLSVAASALAQPMRSASREGDALAPSAPRFEAFPAMTAPPARSAPLVLTPRDRQYRTRLQAAAAGHPNFAGHYVLTTWGCGTECLYGAAVNLRTGRVTFLPFATCCASKAPDSSTEMISSRPDSSLLVLLGMRDQRGSDIGTHYYRMQGDRLVHLRSVPFPARR